MLTELVGARLLAFSENGFTVGGSGGHTKSFVFDEDQGDCCGYAEMDTKLLVELGTKNAPVITRVEKSVEDSDYDSEVCKVTFFGESKILASINAECGSGSGWHYGACVTVRCVETKEEEILSSW